MAASGLSLITLPVTRPRIRRSSYPVVDILFFLVVGARSILIWMGRVSRGTYGRPFGCLDDTNKEKTNSNHIPYHLKPILIKGGNQIEQPSCLIFAFPSCWLPSTIKLHFLLTSGWELASNLGLLAGGSLSPSFPVRPRYGTWTRSYDQIRLDLVLSDPTSELRTAGLFWTVERGEGESCPFSLRARAGTSFRPNTCTWQNDILKKDVIRFDRLPAEIV